MCCRWRWTWTFIDTKYRTILSQKKWVCQRWLVPRTSRKHENMTDENRTINQLLFLIMKKKENSLRLLKTDAKTFPISELNLLIGSGHLGDSALHGETWRKTIVASYETRVAIAFLTAFDVINDDSWRIPHELHSNKTHRKKQWWIRHGAGGI